MPWVSTNVWVMWTDIYSFGIGMQVTLSRPDT
jgi:hypothetical protein